MKNKLFLLLGSLALAIVPSSVYADTQGYYDLNKVIYVHYAVNDGTLHYDSTIKDTSIVQGPSSPFYQFNQGVVSSNHINNNVLYTPAFFKVFSGNTMNLCNDSCDLMLTFSYGLASYNTHDSLDEAYMNAFRRASTNLGGIKLVGTDIYDNPKEFYCTGQYLIGGDIGSLDGTYNKFFTTCPTSNFKSISYILIGTGFRSVYNPSATTLNYTYFFDDLDYTISAYTGTQDGIGGSTSSNDDPTEEEILLELQNLIDMDIDSNDKTPPNTDDYNDYVDAEQDLFDQMDSADIDDMQIAIDVNSSNWVWDRITSWLATNPLLSSFLISMLSIGIIKMALGR